MYNILVGAKPNNPYVEIGEFYYGADFLDSITIRAAESEGLISTEELNNIKEIIGQNKTKFWKEGFLMIPIKEVFVSIDDTNYENIVVAYDRNVDCIRLIRHHFLEKATPQKSFDGQETRDSSILSRIRDTSRYITDGLAYIREGEITQFRLDNLNKTILQLTYIRNDNGEYVKQLESDFENIVLSKVDLIHLNTFLALWLPEMKCFITQVGNSYELLTI